MIIIKMMRMIVMATVVMKMIRVCAGGGHHPGNGFGRPPQFLPVR